MDGVSVRKRTEIHKTGHRTAGSEDMSRHYFIAGELLERFLGRIGLADKLRIYQLKVHSTEACYGAF
jgi:hypothetical protein